MTSTETSTPTKVDTSNSKSGINKRELNKVNNKNEAEISSHKTDLAKKGLSFIFYLACFLILALLVYSIYLYLTVTKKETQLSHLFKVFEWAIPGLVSFLGTHAYISKKIQAHESKTST